MDQQVAAYIEQYPSDVVDLFSILRQMIFACAPCEPEEKLWARMPSYYVGDAFVRLIPFKDHINVEAKAAIQHRDELGGSRMTPKGMIKLRAMADIPCDVLEQLLTETLTGRTGSSGEGD